MNEEYGTLITEITAPSKAGLKSFVYDLSDDCQTTLEIVYEDKGLLRHGMRIKVSGYRSQLDKFKSSIEEAIDDWKMHMFTSEHYKVKDVSINSISPDTLMVEVDAHRFSGIKNLATKIYNHFDIPMAAEEKKSLFNKHLTLQVSGNPKQLECFKSIFLTYVHSKNSIKLQNLSTENDIANNHPNPPKVFRF